MMTLPGRIPGLLRVLSPVHYGTDPTEALRLVCLHVAGIE